MRKLLLLVALGAACANATIITFSNGDNGATSAGPFPNTASARTFFTTFAGTLGGISDIDFESAVLGAFSSLSSGNLGVPGVSLDPAGSSDGDDTTIQTTDLGATGGFNTTPGGSQYLYFEEIQDLAEPDIGVIFNFTSPIRAFGANFIGVGDSIGTVTLEFNNGSPQSYTIAGSGTGGVHFFGFMDDANLISSVTIRVSPVADSNTEAFGLDDVMYVSSVPEPSTFGFMLVGLGGLIMAGRKWRARSNRN